VPRSPDAARSDEAHVVAPLAPALALRRRAVALSKDGKTAEAIAAWREVLHASPDDADASHQLGLAFAAHGKQDDAVNSFERALHYAPGAVATKLELGKAFLALNRPKDARFNFEDLLAREPNNVDALAGLARTLRSLGQIEDSLLVAQRGVACDPAHPDIALEKAQALKSLKRTDQAIEAFEQVLTLRPDDPEAGQDLAKMLIEAKRAAEAIVVLRKVVRNHSADLTAWLDFGAALLAARAYGEAVDAFRRALALKPTSAAAHANLALALYGQNRLEEALAACDSALAIEPDSSTARFTKGCIHLARGEFGPGWEAYEFRFSMGGNKAIREDIDAPPWCGEDLSGRSILVLGEQANGDYIQFGRYASALCDLGAGVSLFVPARLKRLLSTLPGPVTLLDTIGPHLRPDFQIHLMSLPHRFLRLGLPIPQPPYLSPEAALREHWLERIGNRGLRVGIAWQGWADGGSVGARSVRLEHLRPLTTVPGIRLISLQIGAGVEQIDQVVRDMSIETLGPEFDSGEDGFVDAAAVIASLDLVVTCDTSLAHLAGALGKPTWIALLATPEWRWQHKGTSSCWYPAIRLFRQPRPDDWDSVFRAMAKTLATLQPNGSLAEA
jgi:tetratricopeptide (TPR) repeat protein